MTTNLLRSADPALAFERPVALDDRATSELTTILGGGTPARTATPAEPRPTRGRKVRKGLVAAAAAAVLVAGAVTVGLVTRPTPVVAVAVALPVLRVVGDPANGVAGGGSGAAAARLEGLATVAAQQGGAVSVDPAPVAYRAWSFNARIQGRVTNTAIVTTDHLLTLTAAGAGSERVTVASIAYPTSQSRAAWEQDAPVSVGDVVSDQTFAAGGHPGLFSGPTPHDPVAMRAFLAAGHPIDAYGPGELVVAITDLAQERHLSGRDTATTLRTLAREPGIAELGIVSDRAGRSGVAFAANGDFTGLPTRFVLVIDPLTGRILASETWLTTSAGALGLTPPVAIDYRLFDYP